MPSKYIVTVDSIKGIEIICRSKDGPFVDKSRADNFVLQHSKAFPDYKYHIYRLEEVVDA